MLSSFCLQDALRMELLGKVFGQIGEFLWRVVACTKMTQDTARSIRCG